MKNNIILIGMPGVGKSTIGVIAAKQLGFQFVDADLVIQQQENRLLSEIIAQDGIDGFLQIENQVNSSSLELFLSMQIQYLLMKNKDPLILD